MEKRREALKRAAVALRAHEPERTLERGYALVEGDGGEPLTSAAETGAAERISLRFSDGRVSARPERRDDA
jgi:exodeoxyribonuclease VII large subunit